MLSNVASRTEDQTDLAALKRFLVLVPAYEPNDALLNVVNELLDLGKSDPAFQGIVVVNDGSLGIKSLKIFRELRKLPAVTVLNHEKNSGKGAALKTGFSHIYNQQPETDFVVTADADGQHTPVDVMRLAKKAIDTGHPNIGSRHFTRGVPLRSRFGNSLTAFVFRVATGHRISDTQSGLRTLRRVDLPEMMDITANRYDYEFHCLFRLAKRGDTPLDQIGIETIYEPGNPTSHFNPLLDSLRIYAVLLRYVSVSAVSAFVDFLIFSLLSVLNVPIGPALVASRIGSMPIYFYGMRNLVFQSNGKVVYQALATLLLMGFHVAFLWMFISYLEATLQMNRVVSMALGMLTFYVATFLVQKHVVYRPHLKPSGNGKHHQFVDGSE